MSSDNEGPQILSGNELLNIPRHTQAVERMIKLKLHPAKFVAKKLETVTLKQPYKVEK